jgi:hypothetical protein
MMADLPLLLGQALDRATAGLTIPAIRTLTPETNVFEALDSLTIVNLLLETEILLETATGNYVTLADETIFDASKSPLIKWSRWIEFVEARHAG